MRRIVILMVGAVAVLVTNAPPARASGTNATFTLTAGSLMITAPSSVDLGSGPPSSPIVGSLGTVTVTDARRANPSDWTATVSSTGFTSSTSATVPASAVTYTPGATTATSGNGVFTPGPTAALSATPVIVYSHAFGTGINTCSWNPSLSVAVPGTAPTVIYGGTVIHQVA